MKKKVPAAGTMSTPPLTEAERRKFAARLAWAPVAAMASMPPHKTEAELRDQYRKVIRRTIKEIGRIQKSV